jgi:hypothetical protein
MECPRPAKTDCPDCAFNDLEGCTYDKIPTPYDNLVRLLGSNTDVASRYERARQEAYRLGWIDGQRLGNHEQSHKNTMD